MVAEGLQDTLPLYDTSYNVRSYYKGDVDDRKCTVTSTALPVPNAELVSGTPSTNGVVALTTADGGLSNAFVIDGTLTTDAEVNSIYNQVIFIELQSAAADLATGENINHILGCCRMFKASQTTVGRIWARTSFVDTLGNRKNLILGASKLNDAFAIGYKS